MDYSGIEILLRQKIGLDATTIGVSAIEMAVRRRVQACSLTNWPEYLAHLHASEAEVQALVEAVVVPETWFFRDKTAFSAMVALAREEQRAQATSKLKLLSAPCSSGEEPFSMVMALLDAGLAIEQLEVDGWDISSLALAKGRAAIYGKNSFRGEDVSFRRRHFEALNGDYRVKDPIRRVVSFHQGNLLPPASGWTETSNQYDFVFCRNLLIYLARPAQEHVLSLMNRLLKPDGVLFVSAAESGLCPAAGFESAGLTKSFAFRKAGAGTSRSPRTFANEPDLRPSGTAKTSRSSPSSTAPSLLPAAPIPPCPSAAEENAPKEASSKLQVARYLADQGQLREAARICMEYLKVHQDSADGYYLLGVVQDATGNEQAADQCYRKVLYLDPNHDEALWQLSLLTERRGNPEAAALLQERARRLQQRWQP